MDQSVVQIKKDRWFIFGSPERTIRLTRRSFNAVYNEAVILKNALNGIPGIRVWSLCLRNSFRSHFMIF